MRGLETRDVFTAARLLTKIGIREEIRDVARKAEENKGKTIKADMGFDLLFGILEKATQEECEVYIYKFIADLFECDWEEVRSMNPVTMFKKLEEVANIEEWKDFFGYVKRLITRK